MRWLIIASVLALSLSAPSAADPSGNDWPSLDVKSPRYAEQARLLRQHHANMERMRPVFERLAKKSNKRLAASLRLLPNTSYIVPEVYSEEPTRDFLKYPLP